MSEAPLYLTDESVNAFYQFKLDSGVSPTAVAKYKNAFDNIIKWLGEDRELTTLRLQEWRQFLESSGFSKYTIQCYVKRINDYLRLAGCKELCIPKPIRNDLRGKTFGYLTAIEPTEKRHKRKVVWRCKCKCGKEVELPSGRLLSGQTTSCGCLSMEILKYNNRYEEDTDLRWALEDRVLNPNSASGYVGVQPKRDKWTASITYKKKLYRLGTFSNIEDAVKARARVKEAIRQDAERIYAETDHLYQVKPTKAAPPERIPFIHPDPVIIPAKRSNNSSGYPGIHLKERKWVARISFKKVLYQLGTYSSLEDAVSARKRAEELVKAGDLEMLRVISTNRKK